MSETGSESAGSYRRQSRSGGLWRVLILVVAAIAAVWIGVRLWRGLGTSSGPSELSPRTVHINPDLKPADHIPAEAGACAGCNVLLIALDTTRADRLGVFGNQDIATPSLDRLAREGVLFTQAVAPSPTTLPSHASMLTGLYPIHHDARMNGSYRLAPESVTLAEVLTDAGYDSAAFVSTVVLDDRYGLGQGFSAYSNVPEASEATQTKKTGERTADATTDAALEWLRQPRQHPFFLWVHYYDPHYLWEPPASFKGRFDHPYDGEIAFMDSQIGRLIDALAESGQAGNTLIVVAADHGEGVGQHEEWTHGFLLYQSTLHVPVIFHAPGRIGGGLRVDRPVSLVDILPTALSLLELSSPQSTDGVDLTRAPDPNRLVFSETNLAELGLASLRSVQRGKLKYIHSPQAELFDLNQDPFEKRNLLKDRTNSASELRSELTAFFGDELAGLSGDDAQVLTPSELAALESLGYVGVGGSGGAAADSGKPLPDPKEVMEVISAVEVARAHSMEDLTQRFEELTREHPWFALGFQQLARAYVQQGDIPAAERTLYRGLESDPTNPRLLLLLGKIKLHQQDLNAAADVFRSLIAARPRHIEARLKLGRILNMQGRTSEAADMLLPAFRLAPRDETLRAVTLNVLTAAGRTDQAIDVLQQASGEHPQLDAVWDTLFGLLMSNSRFEEAAAVLRRAIAAQPDNPGFVNNLAALLAACPDPEVRRPAEAVSLAETLCLNADSNPHFLYTLSVAQAAAADREAAAASAKQALTLARQANAADLVLKLQRHLQALNATSQPSS